MGGIVLAWLVGEGIVTWRWAKAGAPPTPGALLSTSGFFALLALLGQYPPARSTATLIAFGVDIAALLQVLPGSKVTQVTGWPPPVITDTSVILPTGSAHSGGGGGGNPSNTPAAVGGANKANQAPQSTPPNPGIPPTGPGTIFPPGSQSL
jgi:hypothetical protein